MSRVVMWKLLTVDGSLEGRRNGTWTGTGSFWAMNLSAVRSTCCGRPSGSDYSTKYHRHGFERELDYHRPFDPDGLRGTALRSPLRTSTMAARITAEAITTRMVKGSDATSQPRSIATSGLA